MDDDVQLGDLAVAGRLPARARRRRARRRSLGFCMGGMYTLKAAATGAFDRAVRVLRDDPGARRTGSGPSQREPLDTAAELARRSRSSAARTRGRPAADVEALRAAWRGPRRLRDRRVSRRRPRLRPRARAPRPPPRRRRRRLAPHARVPSPCRAGTGGTPSTGLSRPPPAASLRSPPNPRATTGVGPQVLRPLRGPRALAVEELVAAAALDLEPAEAGEQRERLVHPLAGRADHAGELLLGDGQLELVVVAGQLEQSLGGAAGTSRNTASARASSVARSRCARRRHDVQSSSGRAWSTSRTGSYASTMTGDSRQRPRRRRSGGRRRRGRARRTAPRSRAPRPRTRARRVACVAIAIRPVSTTNSSSAGRPGVNSSSLRS